MRPFRVLRNLATTGAVMVLVICCHSLLHGQQGGAPTLPPGEGRELVTAACTQCHNLRATLMRRDGREGWQRLVEDMVLRGAHLTPEETATIVQYLVQNFGPGSRSAPSAQGGSPAERTISLPPGPGKELVETRCTLCHDLSRVVSQPRTRPEWEQITKDMIARGAQATDQQIQTIVSYLAAQFGSESE